MFFLGVWNFSVLSWLKKMPRLPYIMLMLSLQMLPLLTTTLQGSTSPCGVLLLYFSGPFSGSGPHCPFEFCLFVCFVIIEWLSNSVLFHTSLRPVFPTEYLKSHLVSLLISATREAHFLSWPLYTSILKILPILYLPSSMGNQRPQTCPSAAPPFFPSSPVDSMWKYLLLVWPFSISLNTTNFHLRVMGGNMSFSSTGVRFQVVV